MARRAAMAEGPGASRRWPCESTIATWDSRSARAWVTTALETHGGRAVAVEHVDGVHEADLGSLVAHHERVRTRAAAEEAHALEELAVGHAGRREDDVRARARGRSCGRRDPRPRRCPSARRGRARRRFGTGSGPGSRRRGSASAAAARTPSGAPPMPRTAWTPVPWTAQAIAAERSPSVMSLMRAPVARTSSTSSS